MNNRTSPSASPSWTPPANRVGLATIHRCALTLPPFAVAGRSCTAWTCSVHSQPPVLKSYDEAILLSSRHTEADFKSPRTAGQGRGLPDHQPHFQISFPSTKIAVSSGRL